MLTLFPSSFKSVCCGVQPDEKSTHISGMKLKKKGGEIGRVVLEYLHSCMKKKEGSFCYKVEREGFMSKENRCIEGNILPSYIFLVNTPCAFPFTLNGFHLNLL